MALSPRAARSTASLSSRSCARSTYRGRAGNDFCPGTVMAGCTSRANGSSSLTGAPRGSARRAATHISLIRRPASSASAPAMRASSTATETTSSCPAANSSDPMMRWTVAFDGLPGNESSCSMALATLLSGGVPASR